MPGAFGLETPKDLLGKLERDFDKLRLSPNDKDLAFNFFVTAEQMLDWIHPGSANKRTREDLRNAEPLLQVVSHLANSSKHFDNLAKHHQSVEKSGSFGAFFGGAFFGGGFQVGDSLLILLKGDAANAFGPSRPALDIAERVLAYWRSRC
jgi:hypothetical protein